MLGRELEIHSGSCNSLHNIYFTYIFKWRACTKSTGLSDFNWKRCLFRTFSVLVLLFIAETVPSFGRYSHNTHTSLMQTLETLLWCLSISAFWKTHTCVHKMHPMSELPFIFSILDLVGASTVTLLTFVFPPFFYMRLCDKSKDNSEWSQR